MTSSSPPKLKSPKKAHRLKPMLLVTKGFDRVELRGFLRGVIAKEDPGENRKKHGDTDGQERDVGLPTQNRGDAQGGEDSPGNSDDAAQQTQDNGLREELRLDIFTILGW